MDFEQFIENVAVNQRRAARTMGEKNLASLLEAFNKKMEDLHEDADVQVQCCMRGLRDPAAPAAIIRIVEASAGRVIWEGSVLAGMSVVVREVEE